MKISCKTVSIFIALFLHAATSADADSRPNILVILCDDLGYADVGFNGAPDIRTPEIDKLATAGTICTSAYVTHPFCGPSRMGLLSGRYPHTYGGQFNLPPSHAGIEEYNKLGIPETETLISKVLQDSGYVTGAIGKWHLGEDEQYHPNNRGFDDFYGFLGGGHAYFPEQYTAAYQRQKNAGVEHINDYLLPLEHNGKPTVEKNYITDELSQHAVNFIQHAAQKEKPFFLYLAYNAPHSPMEATKEDLALYAHIENKKRRIVAGMVNAVDRGVGMLTNSLKENNLFDNTLIIFLSDNGGKPSLGSSNKPLRGVKGDAWEGGFRVPMFWHWPEKIPAQKYDHALSSLDFYPTFAALAKAEIPNEKAIDGRNVIEDLKNGTDARKGGYIFSMRHRNNYTDISARSGDWKVVRFGDWQWRLFNITADPGENIDLAADYPERVTEMVKAAENWSRTHTEPQWFHALSARDAWLENKLPTFNTDFEPLVGAPTLQAAVHITDDHPVSEQQPAAAPMVRLREGDVDLSSYIDAQIARNKDADRAKAEKRFRNMDDDKNGVVTPSEKMNYENR